MLDSINAFHLSARYHSGSLKVILNLLTEWDLTEATVEKVSDLLNSGSMHLGQTPLHVAARNTDPRATTYDSFVLQ